MCADPVVDTLPALTVRQPYAELIARGTKTLEVRAWTTSYRGPLVIHAAAGSHGPTTNPWAARMAPHLVRGGVLCLVELTAVEQTDVHAEAWTDARWRAAEAAAGCLVDHGMYLWRLERPVRLRFEPCRGALRLWRVDARLVTPLP